jgi:hypothetical protein
MYRPRFELDPPPPIQLKSVTALPICCQRVEDLKKSKIKLFTIAGYSSEIRTTDLVNKRRVSAQPTCSTEETGVSSEYMCRTECTRAAETELRFTEKIPYPDSRQPRPRL